MILALGHFSITKVVNAAINMSLGKTAVKNAPIHKHNDGWGMVWHDVFSERKLSHIRDCRPISTSCNEVLTGNFSTNFLAIHVRSATLPSCKGLEFTHPIHSDRSGVPWYLMHNGFLPTVYEMIGLQSSKFDTQEYYEYIIPNSGTHLDKESTIKKLKNLREGGTSGNAIIINPNHVYVLHWHMPNIKYQDYFTLHSAYDGKALYIASEIQPSLVRTEEWKPMLKPLISSYRLTDLARIPDI